MDVHTGPQALACEFHVAEDRACIGRGRCHDKVVFAQTRRGAIIHNDAIFAHHQTIANLADCKFGKAVSVDLVQESGCVAALNVDLAQRGDVTDANGSSCRFDFAVNAVAPAFFAAFAKPLRAQPCASFDEVRAVSFGPFVGGRQAEWAEILAPRPACQSANRYG